jgi:hypothetical protein
MEFVNKFALTILYAIMTIIVFTSVMTFMGVEPMTYNPYLYFIMMLLFFYLTLSDFNTLKPAE